MNILDYEGQWAGSGIDMGDTIIHASTDADHEGQHYCLCGGTLWRLVVSFENYEVATYSTDMECVECGSRAKAPTLIDAPDYTPDWG